MTLLFVILPVLSPMTKILYLFIFQICSSLKILKYIYIPTLFYIYMLLILYLNILLVGGVL
jgi:hypothetical protein